MRLICPNCDAQYEVPDEVIPAEGRDVQCSNCGQTWFQHHPDHPQEVEEVDTTPAGYADVPAPGEERAPSPPTTPEPDEADTQDTIFDEVSAPQRRSVSPDVADILREEAEQEARARAQERESLESQPDLGLMQSDEDDSVRNARQARERMAKIRGEDIEDGVADDAATAAAVATAAGSRRDLLPDIDEINSTLRNDGDRQARKQETGGADKPAKRRGGGFRLGFLVMVLLAAVAFYVYVNPDQVKAQVPQAGPYVDQFISQANVLRAQLDVQVTRALVWLNSLTSG